LEHPGWLQSIFGASRMALKPFSSIQNGFQAILEHPEWLYSHSGASRLVYTAPSRSQENALSLLKSALSLLRSCPEYPEVRSHSEKCALTFAGKRPLQMAISRGTRATPRAAPGRPWESHAQTGTN
jgi:hypothetical protein